MTSPRIGGIVVHIEAMPSAEGYRWLELLSYLHALVYHDRGANEREALEG